MNHPTNLLHKLPDPVQQALTLLRKSNFEAFVIGGCVRDVLMGREPKDWDVTTNALPDQIQHIFPQSLYLNTFGTVTVRITDMDIEITTFRSDGEYSDNRHPDRVEFGVSLYEDMLRRDFTMNAIAFDGEGIIDDCNGVSDIAQSVIRAVGNPTERFQEDALRMMRAIRFSSQLRFKIEPDTWDALVQNADLILNVSGERIRDELIKILETEDPLRAFVLLLDSGVLVHIMPELTAGVGVEQNLHHIYSVFTHNVYAMQFCPSDDWQVRLAALLHDVGKPDVKEGSGHNSTFYNHEYVGGKIARNVMRRLAFSKKDIDRVVHLIRHHMFYYNVGEITDAGVRRLLRRVGTDYIHDLMAVRIADRMGSGVFKEKPYKLLELEKRIEYVQKDPLSTSMLKINGDILMKQFGLQPGAKVGVVLHRLLDEVVEDPARNTDEYLLSKARELIDTITEMSETEARAIMKEYREQLADINAYKE